MHATDGDAERTRNAYALKATRDPKKVMRIARQLKTGSVVHNDASVIYGVTEAPFGGRKDSGLGQVNGRGALRSYTHTLPILIDRWGLKKESIWYPYADKTVKALDGTIRNLFGNHVVRRFMR